MQVPCSLPFRIRATPMTSVMASCNIGGRSIGYALGGFRTRRRCDESTSVARGAGLAGRRRRTHALGPPAGCRPTRRRSARRNRGGARLRRRSLADRDRPHRSPPPPPRHRPPPIEPETPCAARSTWSSRPTRTRPRPSCGPCPTPFQPDALSFERTEAEHLISGGLHLAGGTPYELHVLDTPAKSADEADDQHPRNLDLRRGRRPESQGALRPRRQRADLQPQARSRRLAHPRRQP